MESHISYEQLLKIVSWSLFTKSMKGTHIRNMPKNLEPIEGAVSGGLYIGSPGKDIFFLLPFLNEEQFNDLAERMVDLFPKTPPLNHVNIAACVRYIYGQFDKNGIFLSKGAYKKVEKHRDNWDLPRQFLIILEKKLQKKKKYYGISVLYEMEGHRLGDEAVLDKDKDKLKRMEEVYNTSVEYALKCNSSKHTWTPYYWAFKYFERFGDKKNALKYLKKAIESNNNYNTECRPGYMTKMRKCVEYIKENDKNDWKKVSKKYGKNYKNECIKQTFKKNRK